MKYQVQYQLSKNSPIQWIEFANLEAVCDEAEFHARNDCIHIRVWECKLVGVIEEINIDEDLKD